MPQTRAGQAFISMLAGYQLYAPRDDSQIKINHVRTSSSTTSGMEIPVTQWWRQDSEGWGKSNPREALYVGNLIYYKYAEPVSTVSNKTEFNAIGEFRSSNLDGGPIFERFFPEMVARLKQAGHKIPLPGEEKGVSTPSERMGAIGAPISAPRKDPRDADPIDVIHKKQAYQVTFTALTTKGHHGLYGKAFDAMKADFARYRNMNLTTAARHQMMANRALQYFQGRLVTWNRAMAQMQVGRKRGYDSGAKGSRGALGAESLRMSLLQAGGGADAMRRLVYGFRVLNRRGFNQIAGNPTGFFGRTAADFVRTALGRFNFQRYRRGVIYTFPLSDNPQDRFKHVHLGLFKLFSRNGMIQFDQRALNMARVVTGFDSLSSIMGSDLRHQTEHSVTANQFAAQVASEAKVTDTSTRFMTLQTTQAAGALSGLKKRMYPHIDIIHANKQMSNHLKKFGVKKVKRWFKSYLNKSDSKLSQALGRRKNFRVNNRTFWALPYLSFADYETRFW